MCLVRRGPRPALAAHGRGPADGVHVGAGGWIDAEQARLAELGLTPAMAVENRHRHGRRRHLWAERRWDTVRAELTLDASAGQPTYDVAVHRPLERVSSPHAAPAAG